MAGHSQFKNIMHRKGRQDALRAKRFTKIIKEIEAAAKNGAVPEFNPRLRTAICNARTLNVPKDKIDNAIKKAEGGKGVSYEEIRYEGYAPGGVAIIINALTDNRNRTAGEIRSAFTKSGGCLGETNSVSYMFERLGFIEYSIQAVNNDKIFEAALNVGADNYYLDNDLHIVECAFEKLNAIKEKLTEILNLEPLEVKILWKPHNFVMIDDIEKAIKLIKFIDILEDNDDVQSVSSNYKIDSKIENQL